MTNRIRVAGLVEQGYSPTYIARELGVQRSFAYRWSRHFKLYGDVVIQKAARTLDGQLVAAEIVYQR